MSSCCMETFIYCLMMRRLFQTVPHALAVLIAGTMASALVPLMTVAQFSTVSFLRSNSEPPCYGPDRGCQPIPHFPTQPKVLFYRT